MKKNKHCHRNNVEYPYYIILQYIKKQTDKLFWRRVLQFIILYYIILQYIILYYIILQYIKKQTDRHFWRGVLQY